jgi:hypothetical protein
MENMNKTVKKTLQVISHIIAALLGEAGVCNIGGRRNCDCHKVS